MNEAGILGAAPDEELALLGLTGSLEKTQTLKLPDKPYAIVAPISFTQLI